MDVLMYDLMMVSVGGKRVLGFRVRLIGVWIRSF